MVNPLLGYFRWLRQENHLEEKVVLCDCLLQYFPGYPAYDREGTFEKLVSICKNESSPFKLYGMCIFIHAYTSHHFYNLKGNYSFPNNDEKISLQKAKISEMEKSWLELEKKEFNPNEFDEYRFWVMEETFYGDENTRIKSMWEDNVEGQ